MEQVRVETRLHVSAAVPHLSHDEDHHERLYHLSEKTHDDHHLKKRRAKQTDWDYLSLTIFYVLICNAHNKVHSPKVNADGYVVMPLLLAWISFCINYTYTHSIKHTHIPPVLFAVVWPGMYHKIFADIPPHSQTLSHPNTTIRYQSSSYNAYAANLA